MAPQVPRYTFAMNADWEQRVADLWTGIDDHDADDFVARIDKLVAELPPGSALGYFERGAAQDSTGRPEQAVELYRAALDAGLTGVRRRRAIIQMASSLRNMGDAEEAAALLTAELHDRRPSGEKRRGCGRGGPDMHPEHGP